MPDMFIVTIEFLLDKIKVNIDLEIPSMMLIKDIRVKILKMLKNIYAGNFLECNECCLVYSNRILNDNETLANAGVFDGSYIKVHNL